MSLSLSRAISRMGSTRDQSVGQYSKDCSISSRPALYIVTFVAYTLHPESSGETPLSSLLRFKLPLIIDRAFLLRSRFGR